MSNSETYSDDQTRRDVKKRLAENLYIEAGAGTGKTEALVTRLTELLVSRTAEPEQIAAITFTRAAAFEMRSRLRTALEIRADEAQAEDRTRIVTVLDGLDSLAIQTIHAFALTILREHPLDAGLPPLIESVDDVLASVEFDDRWNEWFADRIASDTELVTALIVAQRLELPSPADVLRDIARKLDEHYHLLNTDSFGYRGPDPAPIPVARIAEVLNAARSAVAEVPEQNDAMCKFVSQIGAPALESLVLLAGDETELPAHDFADAPKFRGDHRGSQKNWSQAPGGKESLTELRDLFSDFQEEIDASLDALRQKTVMNLLHVASDFAVDYARQRRQDGRLTFHDQLVLARRLLESNDKVRRSVLSRHRFILVDEFQDTDPVQIDLLRLLGSDERGALLPGRLFLVGDPKQSIYRFRGADPVSASEFSTQVAASGERFPLSENHRSMPGVIRWVNAVFSSWMSAGASEGQAPYRDLRWETKLEVVEPDEVPVQWFGGERETRTTDTRRLEFEEISAIAEAAGSGAFSVRDENGEWRESSFSDVAVLLRSRTGVDLLEQALTDRQIPYVFDSQSPLFTSQDVRDLHSCLVAIDDPSDEVAVLAAIRSPAFACSDTDLLRWKQVGGSFSYLTESRPHSPQSVAQAYEVLNSFHHLSRELDTAALVERFVRDRQLREKSMLSREGIDRVRRIDTVVELAGALSDPENGSSYLTLRDFTRWLARQSEENARFPEHVSQGASTDAVRIMTIHTAKGLEFPIVVMASSSSNSRGTDTVKLITSRSGDERVEKLEAQLGNAKAGLKTFGADVAIENDKSQGELEDVRLLYVAATRARDHLLVSRYRSKSTRASLAEKIEEHLEGHESLWREWQRPTRLTTPKLSPRFHPDKAEERDAWLEKRESAIAAASRTLYTTPTALKPTRSPETEQNDTTGEPLNKEPREPLDDALVAPGRGATDLGRAVHAVLQYVQLGNVNESEIQSLAQRMATEHGVVERVSEIVSLTRAALGTETMQQATEASRRGEAWREVSVAAALPDSDGELEGQIDLMFLNQNGTVTIVDHKTDRERGNSLEGAAEPYLLQMGAYAWCVEQVTGLPVSRAVLIFASRVASVSGGEYQVPQLDHYKEEASRLASQRVSALVSSD